MPLGRSSRWTAPRPAGPPAATLTQWSEAILVAYLKRFGAELLDTAPLFWTRGGRHVSRDGATGRWGGDHGSGRHIAPLPYTKSSLNQDFAAIRELAFGKHEKRQLQDMRRSRAVEGDAGGGSVVLFSVRSMNSEHIYASPKLENLLDMPNSLF